MLENERKSDLSLLDDVMDHYRGVKGSLITVLQQAQEIYGYLPQDVLRYIAEQLGLKPAKVFGVASFYAQFRFEPVGKYLIMLCKGTACHVNGADSIGSALEEELEIHDGGTTPDGLFTLKYVACLGCCSLSPVMMINEETYGSLTPDKARKIIRDLRKAEEVSA